MKVLKRLLLICGFITLTTMLLIACSNEETDTNSTPQSTDKEQTPKNSEGTEEKNDPITLSVGTLWDENMFNDRFKEPVESKFPHITLEHVHVNNFDRQALEEMFSSGTNPDFFFTLSQEDIEYFQVDQDLTDLLELNGIDTSHLNQALLDTIRARDKEGRLLSWPYEDTYYVIMYNKDLFDLFGVDYPSDDMTWDQLIDLSRELTQERDGIQYRGLDFGEEVMLSQLSVNATDPETGEVKVVNQKEFSDFMNMYKSYFDSLPSNYEGNVFTDERFLQRTTAMVVTNAQAINWRKDDDLNYDIATIPTWSDRPGVGPRGFLHTLTLNPNTEHPNDVVKIFEYFSSDEYQKWMSRNGIGIVTNSQDLQDEFYADYESAQGKNIPAIFKNNTAPPPERISMWDKYVSIDMQKFYESGMDASEFLRVVTEESETKIKDAKAQQ
ncbi:ABC transporter substrate-binding protein [Bacillus niameyensis]|uniref:ABC transporter substrate-binding protein n=1 Tax=Bacillus niameyensis TaxID=1522308 RepID=UPI000784BCB5|nr:extracellular solute-binding protein [Bacillus niameyensis]